MTKLVVRMGDVQGYSPANHHGTLNHRLIAPETVGPTPIEVLHGHLQPGGLAQPHAHPGIAQVCYLLEGRARVSCRGVTEEMGPGDSCFFPADEEHSFEVIGDTPVRVLVIYTPPYGEDPAKVIKRG
jgi:mannose-6-phosphate isomerase-like protein (cupin superfamily)